MLNNLPAVVANAPMPTKGLNLKRKHWLILTSRDASNSALKIDKYTRLIPEGDIRAAISELERSLYTASDKEAIDLGELLVGSYTKKALNDPDIFTRAIASIFQKAPPDIGAAAVDHITKHLRFHPERADVYAVVSKMVEERGFALGQARAHLAEHERRNVEVEPERESEEERQAGAHQIFANLYIEAGMDVPEGKLSLERFYADVEDDEKRKAVEDEDTLEARKAEAVEQCKEMGA